MTGVEGAPQLPELRCLGKLGAGGFSDVYLYERDQPRIKVAVKLMRSDVLDAAERQQFVHEADVMAELAEHPFIVPVLGAGTSPDGRPYLVMRYYPPPDLGVRVATEPLSVQDSLRTGIQIASAVETAHRNGIIHRDIKPSNILVDTYGTPGLSDFGIAGRGEDRDDEEHIGVSMPWSPPEVLTGASNGTATSDVYSLAATLWNLLVGRSPFTIKGGDNGDRAMFTRILHTRPPATGRADVPGSLDRLLQQAMAKDPDQRPQSALELARHLQRVQQELRLDRTEIVVLDISGDHDGPTKGAPPGGAAARSAEKTSARAPRVGTTAGEETTIRPTRTPSLGSRDRGSAAPDRGPRARQLPSPAAAAATTQRPVRPSQGVETTGAGSTAADVPDRAGVLTSRRSRTVAGVAAGLVVATIVTGVVLGRDSGGAPGPDLPTAPEPSSPLDVLPGTRAPEAPRVEGDRDGPQAVFRWQRELPGDEYVVRVVDGPTEQVAQPVVRVAIDGRPEVCVQVIVRRGSLASAPSSSACVEAG